ncbi:UvrD-helicase domain-containing protein [Candidatus Palauibacter sp.]|uniref:UvrD-helicase domain-containing protein n=1 Tax=Candidatus Palauibacter sp. TaxID=3101350 RepID=UPI003CC58BDF
MNANPEPSWLEGIEGEDARSLISSSAPLIRVVAGPGSGKTTCLKRRTERLVRGADVDGRTVFVGTFTRAIARELVEALSQDINISTLHSLAYGLLRKYPEARQGMRLRFLLEFEQGVLLYDIARSLEAPGTVHDRRREPEPANDFETLSGSV